MGVPLPAPELVVPGDTNPARALEAVNRITVSVQNPTPTTPPAPGAVTVEDGPRTTILGAAQLAKLPSQTLDVTFQAGTATQQHVEIGPTLQDVLRAAHIHSGLSTRSPRSAPMATSPRSRPPRHGSVPVHC